MKISIIIIIDQECELICKARKLKDYIYRVERMLMERSYLYGLIFTMAGQ